MNIVRNMDPLPECMEDGGLPTASLTFSFITSRPRSRPMRGFFPSLQLASDVEVSLNDLARTILLVNRGVSPNIDASGIKTLAFS